MHPGMFSAFERLCAAHQLAGPVLEIGAVAAPDTLLNLPCLARLGPKFGINLAPQAPVAGATVLVGNANAMPAIGNGSIGVVLCNAVLEHDPKFWLTLGEILRVLRSGGFAFLGVPGYAAASGTGARLATVLGRLFPGSARLAGNAASTPTLNLHNFPSDYYRFSAAAMREVFLAGLDVHSVETLLHPPRLIGVGQKP